jgi:hypothetical protein
MSPVEHVRREVDGRRGGAMEQTSTGLPAHYTETELSMSNFDHTVDEGLREALEDGPFYGRHAGWNFNGLVWWDGDQFREQVWVYGAPVKTFVAPVLDDLMRVVNVEFGWE